MLLLIFASAPAFAATLTVDAAGGGDFTTLTEALAAAASGDTLEVAPGTYAECLDLRGKDIDLVSTGGSAATFLDCGGAIGSALLATAGERLSLTGFTVRNGSNRALRAVGGSVSIDDLIVEDAGNTSLDGGALHVTGGALSVANSTFNGNLAWKGGAIYVSGAVSLTMEAVTAEGNGADQGGFLYLDNTTGPPSVEMVDVEVSTSTAVYDGGALYGEAGSQVSLSGTRWSYNSGRAGTDGGAIYLETGSDLRSETDVFEYNGPGTASTAAGGALYLAGTSRLEMESSSLLHNAAYRGGAVFLGSGATAELTFVSSLFNEARSWGGSIQAADAVTLTVQSCTFGDGLSELSSGGEIYQSTGGSLEIYDSTLHRAQAGEAGGAIYVNGLDSDLVLFNTDIWYSTAGLRGGAVAVEGEMGLYAASSSFGDAVASGGDGGCIYFYPASLGPSLVLLDSAVQGCAASGEGGGIYAFQGATVSVTHTSLLHNVAGETQAGGGLLVRDAGALELRGSTFFANRAYLGGGAYLSGVDAAATVANTAFVQNEALHLGGGLYLANLSGMVFDNNLLLANDADKYGGGLYLYGVSGAVRNTVFAYTPAGRAIYAEDAGSAATSFVYNDWYENVGGDAGGTLSVAAGVDGNIDLPPDFVAYSLDENPDNDNLSLLPGSGLIDAGDPTVLDTDGSRSDIGLYGGPGASTVDADADGWSPPEDCDDANPSVYPGGVEFCDGIDQDCDGEVDEGVMLSLCTDADGDGRGEPGTEMDLCEPVPGLVADCSDCDDADASAFPGAEEVAGDGVDQDCDGSDTPEETGEDGGGDEGGGDGAVDEAGGEGGGKGGCSSAGGAEGLGIGLLGLLGLLGRRARSAGRR